MAITLAQITNAIEDTLDAATTIQRSQSYDQLSEGIPRADTPLLQVYPSANAGTSMESGTDRITFGSDSQTPRRVKEYAIFADYYAHARSNIAEDMSALVDGIEAIEVVLETENALPFFGLAGIQNFNWSWEAVVFTYGDPLLRYTGARFTIMVRVF